MRCQKHSQQSRTCAPANALVHLSHLTGHIFAYTFVSFPTEMCAYHMNTAPIMYDVQNTTLFNSGTLFGDCYLNIVNTAATMFFSVQYQPVVMSVIGSIVVGLSGLFPLLVLPVDDTISLKTGCKYSCTNYFFFLTE